MPNERATALFLLASFLSMGVPAQDDSTRYLFKDLPPVSGVGGLMLHWGNMGFDDGYFSGVGGGGGLLVDKRLMLGGYGQGLTNSFVREDLIVNDQFHEATLAFSHGGVWIMYAFAPEDPIHLFASFQLGWGTAKWKFKDLYNGDDEQAPDSLRTPENIRDRVLVFTPTAGVEFNVFRWFRPNVYIGYRNVAGLSLPKTQREDLDGFFAGVSLLCGSFGERRRREPLSRD